MTNTQTVQIILLDGGHEVARRNVDDFASIEAMALWVRSFGAGASWRFDVVNS